MSSFQVSEIEVGKEKLINSVFKPFQEVKVFMKIPVKRLSIRMHYTISINKIKIMITKSSVEFNGDLAIF